MSATYKVGSKVVGMYYGDRGTCLDHSGVVTAITGPNDYGNKTATVTFSNGRTSDYTLPANDFLAPLRICDGCGARTMLEHDLGNGGCGATTTLAK